MRPIQIHSRFYNIPTQWNELTKSQLLKILKVLDGDDPLEAAQEKLLRILSGISAWEMWYRIGAAEVEDKLYLTNFLFQSNGLTKNLICKYSGLYGPADDFDNLIVSEFIFSELHYSNWKESGTGDALDRLIATLYRPAKRWYNKRKNVDGDIRQPYNEHLTDYYAGYISGWPVKIKMAILHWYEGCRVKMVNDNPEVFGGKGGEALYGLYSVMRGVAEKGIHGNLAAVEKMMVKEFLMELNELVAEAARIEKTAKPT